MGHYSDYYHAEEEERRARIDKRDKIHIQESLERIRAFQKNSYTNGIQYELASIEKFYKSKLYDLRHIEV
jgi:hypothetical protein